MASRAPVVKGKWFVPVIFIGFLVFTLLMCWGTIVLGHSMQPMVEKAQIEAKRAEMEREMATKKAK